MKLIRVAAAVLNQTPLAWDHNQKNIERAIQRAREQGASLLCLPEMCITGYGCEDEFLSPGVQATSLAVLQALLPSTQGMIVSFGLPLLYRNGLFNVAALAVDGQLQGFVAKRFLAGDGIHYEPRWFNEWPGHKHSTVSLWGRDFPIGDVYFECGGVRIGFEICEDAWVAARPGADLALRGIDVILNPSASHFAFGKLEVRRRFVLEGSRAFGTSYVYSNLLGNDAGRAIYDGGALIATGGRMLAVGPRFRFTDCEITSTVIDVDATRWSQARTHSFSPSFDDQQEPVRCGFDFPEVAPEAGTFEVADWEHGEHVKEEEFVRAMTLGLFDYVRKSRSNGFVVSLSGGADSAACACLVALMVEMATADLGRDGFLQKMGHMAALREAVTPREMVGLLLTCAYQATRNSGDVTRHAARSVAEGVGARFFELDVDQLVHGYVGLIQKAIGRELSWEKDDVALQNIQARVRAPSIWMFANLYNALLLATSNRSEAAVGYATMDGDTAGGLSPLAGIDKAFLRRWLRWLEDVGPQGFHAIPALSAVNAQAPTAELRPSSAKQTDEDDLMPYPLLDAVERAAIRDKMMPLEVFHLMRAQFPQYSREQLGLWIDRFFKLWCRNQWKRERYAPSFHLDDENLDPKTWCRFPILSGGFARELAEMRARIALE